MPDVQEDCIPLELRGRLDRWICWRYVYKEPANGRGKWTKPPYRADGRRLASTTNPDTWRSFETVMRAHQRDPELGIGFVFTDTPYCGIDLDACAGDGVLHSGAENCVRRLTHVHGVEPVGDGHSRDRPRDARSSVELVRPIRAVAVGRRV